MTDRHDADRLGGTRGPAADRAPGGVERGNRREKPEMADGTGASPRQDAEVRIEMEEEPASMDSQQNDPPAVEPDPGSEADQAVRRMQEALASLREERDQLYDRWLRAQADLENYRKRVEREREESSRSALASMFRELVGVLDNFDRALLNTAEDGAFAEGIRLIHRQLLDLLAKRGLVPMEKASGQFDPHLHEAVATEVHPDIPHHEILDEVQKGYMFGGRVLRPALVKVSVQPDLTEEGGAEEGS